jgi:diguanylate cyclase (GGDEF)-like protein
MTIDIPTLFLVLMLNCLLVGIIFLAAWFTNRGAVQIRIGTAALVMAAGVLLLALRGQIPDRLSIDVANALIFFGLGLAWAGVRIFHQRPAPVGFVLAGGVIWLAACAIPAFYASFAGRMALGASIAAAYALAAGLEFSRKESEHLKARRPIAILLFFHAAVLIFRGGYAIFGPPSADLIEGNWLQNLLLAEPTVMLVALSLLGVGLVRERTEVALRRTAETDDLTGVRNRRAIFAEAPAVIAAAARQGRPVALLLFDLDHFKTINDRFGHSAGDDTLRAFARIASGAIRETDFFGRIGGEEFAALLPGADEQTARFIAERIRLDFSRAALAPDGASATVSAGVAAAKAADTDFEKLYARADKALYEAKRTGRDRVIGDLAIAS